jgi:hypothetical protein
VEGIMADGLDDLAEFVEISWCEALPRRPESAANWPLCGARRRLGKDIRYLLLSPLK